jgi:alpha-tubulin suppressor-like RCC1 family protein
MSADLLCIAQPNTQIECIYISVPDYPVQIRTKVGEAGTFHLVSDGEVFYAATTDGVLEAWSLAFGKEGYLNQVQYHPLSEQVQGSTSIHASNGNVCAVKDGMPICWGKNSGGQFIMSENIEIPSENAQMIPNIRKPTQLSLGGGHVCVTSGAAGNLRCWGRNADGQLGINRTTISGEPAMTFFNVVEPLKAPAGIDPQNDNTVGLNSDTSQLSTQ